MQGDRTMVVGHEHGHMCCHKRFSWTAVLAGALVGIGLSFLLNLFSIAIGLSIFSTTQEGVATFAIGGLIGIFIGTIVAMFVGGYTAGFLGRPFCVKRTHGAMYGFIAWCLALLIMAVFTTHIGRYVSAYTNFLSHPTVVVATDVPVNAANTANATSSNTTPAVMVVGTEKSIGGIAMTAFIVFAVFFVGALSSAIGGHCGMHCRRDDEHDHC